VLLSEVFSYPRFSLFGTRSRVAANRGFLLSEVLLNEVFQMVQRRLLVGTKSRISLIRGVLLNGSAAKRGVLYVEVVVDDNDMHANSDADFASVNVMREIVDIVVDDDCKLAKKSSDQW
jgi:hypothetical protein